MKINKNKSKLKIDSSLLDLDLMKIMIKLNLKNIFTDADFIEFPNIDPDKLSIEEIQSIVLKGGEIDKVKCFLQLKESELNDVVPLYLPNRTKPVLTLQDVTKTKTKLAIGGEPKLDVDGEPKLDVDNNQIVTYEADEVLYHWIENHYTEFKVNEDGVNYMSRTYVDPDTEETVIEEKLYTDLTFQEQESGEWTPVIESKVKMIEVPQYEEYVEQEMLPDPNGTTEDKTMSDYGSIVAYEGSGKDVIIKLYDKDLNGSHIQAIIDDNKYTVLSKKDALPIIQLWNSEEI